MRDADAVKWYELRHDFAHFRRFTTTLTRNAANGLMPMARCEDKRGEPNAVDL